MKISKKCQYALKAIFELAWRDSGEPVKTRDIAKAQRISPRFTEIILNELKHGGFVESRRGNEGGYLLARDAKELTVREIVEYIEGPISVAPDVAEDSRKTPFLGNEAFKELWQQVNNAVCEVCENKTFAELVKFERAKINQCVANYSI
jgi:Rrf2 family cysteine metabolism transcriptional repressor